MGVDVILSMRPNCHFCEAMHGLCEPLRQLFAHPEMQARGISLSVRPDPSTLDQATRECVVGFPTMLFAHDGRVIRRVTMEGFPMDYDDLPSYLSVVACTAMACERNCV